jgi:hypothetical protein
LRTAFAISAIMSKSDPPRDAPVLSCRNQTRVTRQFLGRQNAEAQGNASRAKREAIDR